MFPRKPTSKSLLPAWQVLGDDREADEVAKLGFVTVITSPARLKTFEGNHDGTVSTGEADKVVSKACRGGLCGQSPPNRLLNSANIP